MAVLFQTLMEPIMTVSGQLTVPPSKIKNANFTGKSLCCEKVSMVEILSMVPSSSE